MLFTAYGFIFLFWPITLIIFFKLSKPRRSRLAMLWLVVASFVFYGWWNPAYLLLLIFSIGINYSIGVGLSTPACLPPFFSLHPFFPRGDGLKKGVLQGVLKHEVGKHFGGNIFRKTLLFLGVAINLATLGYFKYASFFADNINSLTGSHWSVGEIILPLGISFFTFQQVAYLADAYAGKTKDYRFLDYCLFVSFFPQLIAGPIIHHQDMMGQFFDQLSGQRSRQVSEEKNSPVSVSATQSSSSFSGQSSADENLAVGLTMFSMGLFKKVMLADTLATFATPIFNAAAAGTVLTFWDGWIGALAYTLQLYFDFSGYSDMAIGIARTFGIKLPLNFNSPYKAHSISDFWRRWHITLSHFLRDYLYIPLGGGRRGTLIRYRNLFITMTLGGLWHGAGWTFVVWGGLQGLYLIIHRIWVQGCKRLRCEQFFGRAQILPHGLSVAITFISVVVSWVFFRSENLTTALSILSSMTGSQGFPLPAALVPAALGGQLGFLSAMGVRFDGFSSENFVTAMAVGWIVGSLGLVWCFPSTQQWMARYHPSLHFSENYGEQSFVEQKAVRKSYQRALFSQFSALRWYPSWFWAIACTALSLCTVLSLAKESEFIYFQF